MLDLQDAAPETLSLGGYGHRLTDATTLEVDVPKEGSLNEVFAALSNQNVHVLSMRNKVNRLEELFVAMVETNESLKFVPD